MNDLVVVKLGGSQAASPHLRTALHAMEAAAGRVVVVPGGGPFADAVRAAQAGLGFDDHAAHDMALMAMGQYARALASLGTRFEVVSRAEAIRAICERCKVPIWAPWPMLDRHPDIPASWDVTSDSLALWLAARLDAREVVLVKHAHPAASASIAEWQRGGLVDAMFGRFRAAFAGAVRIATADALGLDTLPRIAA